MRSGDIRLIAFEPIPDIRACTEKNLAEWPSATVLPFGVSRAAGNAVFTFFPNARPSRLREVRTGMQRRVPSRRRWPETRATRPCGTQMPPAAVSRGSHCPLPAKEDTVEVHCELVTCPR